MLRGDDALLLAPTAGGKTEAADLPAAVAGWRARSWRGLSVLYVCPLRALLNNLEPRLAGYAALARPPRRRCGTATSAPRRATPIARRPPRHPADHAGVARGDAGLHARRPPRGSSPACARWSSTRCTPSPATTAAGTCSPCWSGSTQLAGRPLQRIGLSATVGNPDELLTWLQGQRRRQRARRASSRPACRRRAAVPERAARLRRQPRQRRDRHRRAAPRREAAGVLRLPRARSRSSRVGAARARRRRRSCRTRRCRSDERRRAEQAFAEARDCVIVVHLARSSSASTSATSTGSSRSTRRAPWRPSCSGSAAPAGGRAPSRNCCSSPRDDDELLQAAGLLRLWSEGYVEPVVPPPLPLHLVAQQLLALCLQEHRVGSADLAAMARRPGRWHRCGSVGRSHDWLLETGHLDRTAGCCSSGRRPSGATGDEHFLELLSVFTADPEFTVLHGRDRGRPRRPARAARARSTGRASSRSAGRAWKVTYIDWKRRRAFVEPSDRPGTLALVRACRSRCRSR